MLNMFTFDLFIISLIYVVFVVNVVFVNRQRMFCVKVQTFPLFSCLPVFLYINLFVWFSIFVSVCLICRLLWSYGQFVLVTLDTYISNIAVLHSSFFTSPVINCCIYLRFIQTYRSLFYWIFLWQFVILRTYFLFWKL